MNTTKKRKENFHRSLEFSRRAFLGGAGVLAASAALINLKGMRGEAQAANEITPHRPERYGAAHVTYVPTTESNLGSTRIVGPIKQSREAEAGFNRAALGEFGPETARNRGVFVGKYPLGGALNRTLTYLATDAIVGANVPPADRKLPIPDPVRMSKHIKELGFFLRADDVGIGEMRHHASYSSRMIPVRKEDGSMDFAYPVEDNTHHKYVISILIDQDLRTLMSSTGYDSISIAQSFRSYSTSGFIAVALADYIRQLGYSARAHHARNYNMILAPNLISSGMGELSRAQDCVLHPRLGFRFKAAIVSTDMPLAPDTPIEFGVHDFCRVCMKCAEECPSKAISTDKDQKEHNGYMTWRGEVDKCVMFRVNNEEGSSCGRCMKVCPWCNKEDSFAHTLGLQATGRFPAVDGLLKDMDDMFGYGTEQVEEFKWWLEWPELNKYPK